MARSYNMELLFSALADRTRLRLLNLMADGEICVCFFVETLREGQPKISRHLAYLRRAGLVEARRDGKWIHYKIAQPEHEGAATIFREVIAWMRNDQEMERDRQRLKKVCCAPKLPVQLEGAPIPAALKSLRVVTNGEGCC